MFYSIDFHELDHKERIIPMIPYRLVTVLVIALTLSGYAQAAGDTRPHPATNGPNNTTNNVGGAGGFGQGGAGGSGGTGGFGQGGSATSISNAVANPRASSRANSTSNSSVTLDPGAIGSGGNNVIANSPPGFALPSFGGGQCGIVGFGLAISPSGGGAIGPAWESTNCRNYYIALALIAMGERSQGLQLLSMITPEAAKVISPQENTAAPSQPHAPPAAQNPMPDWCSRAHPTTEASRTYVVQMCGGAS